LTRFASLSLDLDNKWAYLKTRGDKRWESYPTYIDTVVPLATEMLRRRSWKITFFIVGQDAADPRNSAALRSIAADGHEIGNHSFRHEPWLNRYSLEEVEQEIGDAEEAIASATGCRPRGFRGPGFSCSPAVLNVLQRRGYHYDASLLPTFVGPLARLYYFASSPLKGADLKVRRELFGSVSDAFRPLRAHRAIDGDATLVEIPVTTFPVIRTPIHFSYVLYLATFSRPLALAYFAAALEACRRSGVPPSILLHPLDFLGGDEVDALDFFPAMNMKGAAKRSILSQTFDEIASRFGVITMSEHADRFGK
jgi:hypothetical protein